LFCSRSLPLLLRLLPVDVGCCRVLDWDVCSVVGFCLFPFLRWLVVGCSRSLFVRRLRYVGSFVGSFWFWLRRLVLFAGCWLLVSRWFGLLAFTLVSFGCLLDVRCLFVLFVTFGFVPLFGRCCFLFGWLVGWLLVYGYVGWLVGWLVGLLLWIVRLFVVGWFVGLFTPLVGFAIRCWFVWFVIGRFCWFRWFRLVGWFGCLRLVVIVGWWLLVWVWTFVTVCWFGWLRFVDTLRFVVTARLSFGYVDVVWD